MARLTRVRGILPPAAAALLATLSLILLSAGCDGGSDPIIPPDDSTETVFGPPFGCIAWFDNDKRIVTRSEADDTIRTVRNTGDTGDLTDVGYSPLWTTNQTETRFLVYDTGQDRLITIDEEGNQDAFGENVLEGFYTFSPGGTRVFYVTQNGDTTRVWRYALAPVSEYTMVAEYVLPWRVRHAPSVITANSLIINVRNTLQSGLSQIEYWMVGDSEPYETTLLNTQAFYASPGGDYEAYVRDEGSTLSIVVDGTSYDLSAHGTDLVSFLWSPMQNPSAATLIAAYVSDDLAEPATLVVVDPFGGTVEAIQPEEVEWHAGWEDAEGAAWTWPDWNPDGSKLVGMARGADGNYRIVTTDLDGNATVVAHSLPFPCRPTWNPHCEDSE
ncbi:hypothetical protein GF324_13630 [bacterium]|nr:hypothetical protein [bacterium]